MTTTHNNLRISTLKVFDLVLATARENLITPISLPTSEPVTPQVSYTVQQSDMPTITPKIPFKNIAMLFLTGRTSAVTAGTISWRVLKNGVSVATGASSSMVTNVFWSLTFWRWLDVVPGDVLEVSIWSTNAAITDFTFDFSALHIGHSQPVISKPGVILKDLKVVLSSNAIYSSFAGTAQTVGNTGSVNMYPVNGSIIYNVPVTFTLGACIPIYTTYGLYRLTWGEINSPTTNTYTNTTTRQRQLNPNVSQISFREIG